MRSRYILLGLLFALSPIITIFIVEVLKAFCMFNSAQVFYGLLLLLQIFIGIIGSQIGNVRTDSAKDMRKIYMIIPVLLFCCLPVFIKEPGLSGNGYMTVYLEALYTYVFQICGVISVLTFFVADWIGNKKRESSRRKMKGNP